MKRAVILASLLFAGSGTCRARRVNVLAAVNRAGRQTGARRRAASAAHGPLTLKAAVEYARAHYPAIRAALADTAAAESGIGLARTAYLPRTDLLLQFNRATRNNVFGTDPAERSRFPRSPARCSTNPRSTALSAAPPECASPGSRSISDCAARTSAWPNPCDAAGRPPATLTELNVSLGAAEAFLAVVAAEQAMLAARANVDRMEVFAQFHLRAGQQSTAARAPTSRARKAELAQAQIESIRAEQARDLALAYLAEWLGRAGEKIEVEPGTLLSSPPENCFRRPTWPLTRSPRCRTPRSTIVSSRRSRSGEELPAKFFLESAVFGRGTGARVDGTFQGGGNGWAPPTGNWAVGMKSMFPVFDFKENRVRQEIERHHENAASARYDVVVQRLRAGVEKARIQVDNARRIAEQTPVALQAARVLETQARERYRAGLGTVIEVADALRLLRQSEIDDSLAQLAVWRALFAVSAAQGNIDDLLGQTGP